MATIRPVVSVYGAEDASKTKTLKAPAVLASPLRPDLVAFVVDQMNMNSRQAYAVQKESGYQHSAESWGTGRAVARIPRVQGGGTHAAGAGAFGNMCRGGGMFNPNKIWRKWHRKQNTTQKRHAICSALSASAIPALVMARGHRIEETPEIPLVVGGAQGISKTKDAVAMLKTLGLEADLNKVVDSKKIRVGKGKMRNRRYTMRKGPLVVYDAAECLSKACRNIPGVDSSSVDRLNLLQLAPGGHLGRMIVFTEEAFAKLNKIYGTSPTVEAPMKKGYHMPRAVMTNPDITRIINSEAVQAALRPMKEGLAKKIVKKNALKNKDTMAKLNPGSLHRRYKATMASTKGSNESKLVVTKVKKLSDKKTARKGKSHGFYKALEEAYKPKVVEAEAEDDE